MLALLSAPIDTPTLSLFPILPFAHSLEYNGIGAEGATALAAVLKETKITNLKCAAAPEVFAFVSAPVDTRLLPPISCSLGYNYIGDEGASALAAVLKETMITNLKCALPRVFAFVSAPIDTPTLSLFPILPRPRSQSRSQPHGSRGRHCTRRHPQHDEDH